jgi:hypothetical protein
MGSVGAVRPLFVCVGYCVMVGACGGVAGGHKSPTIEVPSSEVPTWAADGGHALYPGDTFLVAVGACGKETARIGRAACAAQRALEHIVLSVRANVSAVRERRCVQRVEKVVGEAARGVSNCVVSSGGISKGELQLTDTAPVAQVCTSKDECFALVAIPRNDAGARLRRAWRARAEEVNSLVRQASEADPLTALTALQGARQAAAVQDDLADLIGAIEGQASAPAPAMPAVAARREDFVKRQLVCLTSSCRELPPERTFAAATRSLAAGGFRHVRMAATCGPGELTVAFSARTKESTGPAIFPDGVGGVEGGPTHLVTVDVSGELVVEAGRGGIRRAVSVAARGVAESSDRAWREAGADVVTAADRAMRQLLMGEQEDDK